MRIEDRIRDNIIRDYGKIQSKDELERHIEQHQKHKGNLFENYIAPYFPKDFFKNKSVLEIGCGFGGNIIHLTKNYNCNAAGLDLDSDAIEIAKEVAEDEKLDENIFLNCAAEEVTKYIDKRFDIIISIQVLEHVQDVKKSINEMLSLLKDGGYIYIHVPNYDSKFETHYRLKMPSNKKEDFLKMLEDKKIDTSFAKDLNFVNYKYLKNILQKLDINEKYILPWDNELYRKNNHLSQKFIFKILPNLGNMLRDIIYRFNVPSSIIIIMKK